MDLSLYLQQRDYQAVDVDESCGSVSQASIRPAVMHNSNNALWLQDTGLLNLLKRFSLFFSSDCLSIHFFFFLQKGIIRCLTVGKNKAVFSPFLNRIVSTSVTLRLSVFYHSFNCLHVCILIANLNHFSFSLMHRLTFRHRLSLLNLHYDQGMHRGRRR